MRRTKAAKTGAAPTVTYSDVDGVASVLPTKTDGWTYAFSGTAAGTYASVNATSGEVTFTDNDNISVTVTASKNGYATTVTITDNILTMTNFATTKNIAVSH